MKKDTPDLKKMTKEELIDLVRSTEEKFADSNVHAVELVMRLEEKNDELNSTRIQLEKMASLGELIAGVGHEINNPLTISMGFLDLLKTKMKKRGLFDGEFEKLISRQATALKRIGLIVQGLRIFSRVDVEAEHEVDLHDVIESTLGLVEGMYAKMGITIDSELKADSFHVLGNTGELQQVLMNFLTNARDALKGADEKRVSISTHSDGVYVYLSVSDTGHGIPDDIKKKVFDDFFTTKPVDEGTGIGLALTSKVVKSLRGTVNLESEVGKGTTFIVKLPVVDVDLNQVQSFQEIGQEGPGPINSEPEFSGSVLVVDDEEDIRSLLKENLESFGLEVDTADDGDTAIEKVKLKKYDYIFTDMRMPRMSGDQFITEARKLPFGDSYYLIVTGGVLNCSDEKRAQLERLADKYIDKPCGLDVIKSALEEAKESLSKKSA